MKRIKIRGSRFVSRSLIAEQANIIFAVSRRCYLCGLLMPCMIGSWSVRHVLKAWATEAICTPGYARVSEIVGVLTLLPRAGSYNLITGLADIARSIFSTPLVCIYPAVDCSLTRHRLHSGNRRSRRLSMPCTNGIFRCESEGYCASRIAKGSLICYQASRNLFLWYH